jgi:DNA-binding NarL/FixJ family response regulator
LEKLRILIADNQTLVREGIKSIISSNADFELAGEVLSSSELIPALERTAPDVVIIDYFLPGYFSLADIKRISTRFPETGIMVVSTNLHKADILKTLEYGVNNYILKLCDIHEFTGAIYATVRKERFFCGKVLDMILDKPAPNCEPIELSAREVEIVKLIAKGLTNQSIADKLFLSIHTVGTHRKNILRKLDLNKASELVMYAVQNGLLESELLNW